MKCIFCGEKITKIIDSRANVISGEKRRRRYCKNCNKRFTTYEKPVLENIVIIGKDGKVDPLSEAALAYLISSKQDHLEPAGVGKTIEKVKKYIILKRKKRLFESEVEQIIGKISTTQ